ncbi:dedicator of cytokinesis protein 7-like [Mytilus californianus]|uniref:dedicator of cytokinesis protein 7-like n=1 Tax=Mytilus californianus TaxID=6549 RepID=UPI0022484A65|nr:dedicator of cytokinesis protein 7-like [Mytilus californianus]
MASTGQRAFAQKLNKQGAAEVRKAVSSTVYAPSDLARSVSGLNLTVPLSDVVDPPEYEEFVLQNQCTVERDPHRDLILYPDNDDVDVHFLPKRCRTISHIVPEIGAETDTHVFDFVRRYTADYTVVSRRYQRYSSSVCSKEKLTDRDGLDQQQYEVDVEDSMPQPEKDVSLKRQSIHMNDTPRGSWASSIFDLKQSQADVLLPNLFEQMSYEQVDKQNEDQRQQNRLDSLFSMYEIPDEEEKIERRPPAVVPQEHFGHRILVKCLNLRLELEFEPIFACMALYDSKEKKKISENFYFDMNSDNLKNMISNHVPKQDVSTLSRSCVLSLTYPSPDVFLVIRLEKVLQQGDIGECADPYLKEDKTKEEKHRGNAMQFCDRLGRYRMPFAWTAIYLMNIVTGASSMERESSVDKFDQDLSRTSSLDRRSSSSLPGQYDSFRKRNREDSISRRGSFDRGRTGYERRGGSPDDYGSSLDNFKPVTLTVSSFFKQEGDKLSDEDLYKFLADLKRPSSVLKRVKCLPGTLKLDISPCPEEPRYSLTPELWKVEPYPDDKSRPIKEILEFPSHEVYAPFTIYRNMLYVYPKSLNFANRQGSARNLAVKVQFMAGEEESCALPVIFGKSGGPEFVREAYTPVTYHNKTPCFYDEVKIKLPAKLTEAHHLLFTFYHISCQSKKGEVGPVELPVGYTWLPLCRNSKLLTGEFNLHVSIDRLPAHYHNLYPDPHLPSMKWVDNHKGVFNIAIQAVSSIHTQDDYLEKFLNLTRHAQEQKLPMMKTELQFETDLKMSLIELQKVRGENLIQFLPLVMDKLILLNVRPPVLGGQSVNIGQPAFESMANVVKKVHEILEDKNDHNGRNALLASYIHYTCSLPHPGLVHQSSSINFASLANASGYNTLGRPSSLPLSRQNYQRSTSNPDLAGSTPTSPDAEVGNFLGRYMDRGGSMRGEELAQQMFGSRTAAKKFVHEELALQWSVLSGPIRETAMTYSWFFFELMIKSMAEHLAKCDKLSAPRQMRFPEYFEDDLKNLVRMFVRDIVDKYDKDPSLVKSLNTSLAFFLHDLLTYMDRFFVFQQIHFYCRTLGDKMRNLAESTSLILLKLDFMRVVCSHEHYFPLNLPFGTPLTPSANSSSPTPSISSITSSSSYASTSTLTDKGRFYELTIEFRQQHFLLGIVLSDLSVNLDIHNPAIHPKSINVLRNLLLNHDLDVRYTDPEMKARLAALYMPVIGIVIDSLPQLWDPNVEGRLKSFNFESDADKINQHIAMEIAGSSVFAGRVQESPSYDGSKPRKCNLNAESTRNLLICFMWVIKNVDQSVLRQWWSDMDVGVLQQILDVIYYVVSNFEYRGKKSLAQYSQQTLKKSVDMKSRLEEAILGSSNARMEMMRRRQNSSASLAGIAGGPGDRTPPLANVLGITESGGRLRWRKDQLLYKPTVEQPDMSKPRDVEADAHIEGNLAAEISMTCLDTIELITQIARANGHNQILSSALRVLLHSFGLNQSTLVLQNMFASQRALVTRYLDPLFEEETEQCADLCLRLLKHCSSCIGSIRSQASASLYMLMRQNFELGNNFARVKMQVTMSLSSLVGQNQNFDEEYLRKSLKTILTYAESDYDLQDTTFPEQVKDLVFNLHMILSDTVKMKEFQEDPEMLLDLMYRIAKGYQNSPDLRLTWLQNMASKHSERSNHAEAAHCCCHAAALIAEYLNMIEDKPYLPVGCVDYQKITLNVLEESAVSDDVVSPDEEGICTGKYFTESGLVGLMEQAASSFTMAGMYEAVNLVYKILIPIHEAHNECKKLAQIHQKLHDAFQNVTLQEGKRIFGTYFRVGFYGHKFGDLDGEEFIYKEPAITKLPEISHRLESFYGDRFGEEFIHIVKDSNTVERDKLDQNKAYIQITYVEPYFDLYEKRNKTTYFEQNYNIKRFMYATPFTLDGRAHGELVEQYKRKTILTTLQTFPYIKTRLSVISREQVILLPIEAAIEDIQKKTKELDIATKGQDTKILQMVLQGCIGTTVNQGPVEVAIVFLKEVIQKPDQVTKHHNKLRLCFKDFLKKGYDALHKNKNLIKHDQKEYQRELERNYHEIKEKLNPLISSKTTTIKRSKHHRRTNKESPTKQKSIV